MFVCFYFKYKCVMGVMKKNNSLMPESNLIHNLFSYK